jgi:hypothetical protein
VFSSLLQPLLRRATLLCLGAAAVVAVAGCAPRLPGRCVRTSRIELHTDLPAAEAGALAAEAAIFLEQVSGYLGSTPSRPRIYVFRSGWDLWRYLRAKSPPFAERTGACFEDEDGVLTVGLAAASRGRPDRRSLRHELTHAVVGARFSRPMPWLDEGLAQVLESGCPPSVDLDRMEELSGMADGAGLRLARLLAVTEHRNLDETDYLVAWGFTWFLLDDERYGRPAVLRGLAVPVPGESATARAARCLGSTPSELAARFQAYLRRRRGPVNRRHPARPLVRRHRGSG